ncbi:hypothetical protein CS063_17295 [Sporanaerobium hydrogeniformans]|uniref:Uncharacterized protein n=1 Tax=Sporanaerobium hydrogeniformans TaxID=3072179 RepID=A0AC61D6Y4_9FIRM|nr:hypothetical protein [Sporanaerobium hydrogeniformans]PHV69177.1 hypothetical protein CS063_17295 [Sporanaerobium hydrogeniformans]
MVEKKCKTCGWGRQIAESKTIFICGCPLSGCFQTHVIESEGKECNRWKKASDDYLKYIGEL